MDRKSEIGAVSGEGLGSDGEDSIRRRKYCYMRLDAYLVTKLATL